MEESKYWEEPVRDIGTVKDRSKVFLVFKYSGNKVIKKITHSCSCSKPSYNSSLKELSVSITNKIATHLEKQRIVRTIKVLFTDETEDVLTIKGKIIK